MKQLVQMVVLSLSLALSAEVAHAQPNPVENVAPKKSAIKNKKVHKKATRGIASVESRRKRKQERVNAHMAEVQKRLELQKELALIHRETTSLKSKKEPSWNGTTPDYLEMGAEPQLEVERDPYGFETDYARSPDLAVEKAIHDRQNDEQPVGDAGQSGQFDEQSINDFYRVRPLAAP